MSLRHLRCFVTCPYSEPDQSNPFPPIHFLKINFHINLSFKLRSYKLLSFLRLPHENLVRTYPLPIRATCPVHLIFLDLITRLIFVEEWHFINSWLCHFQPPVTSSLLGSNMSMSTLFSKTLILSTFLGVTDKCSRPDKTTKGRTLLSHRALHLRNFVWIKS